MGDVELAYKTRLKTTPGIMKLSLPKNQPGLVVGERYLWQVAMLCDPNHPSSDLVAKAEIERVEMLPSLAQKLSQNRDRAAKIDSYAQAGLWYDALGEALRKTSRNLEIANLLEDLAHIESPTTASAIDRQGTHLRRIAIGQVIGSE
jgi:hypothetical protein